jgi:carbonic anhydrase
MNYNELGLSVRISFVVAPSIIASILFPSVSLASGDPGGISRRPPYSMHAKQEAWGPACVDPGMRLQSPIQLISKKFVKRGDALTVQRFKAPAEIIDTGHTFQVRFSADQPGASMNFEGEKFSLRQFHFHKPSEHLLDGKQYEMEVHFVFFNSNAKSSRKAVALGFLISEGNENPALRTAWKKLPPMREGYGEEESDLADWKPGDFSHELNLEKASHDEKVLAQNVLIDLRKLIPPAGEFMVYEGSLTTPGCEEGITHATSTGLIFLGHDQIERFEGYYEGSNRDLQAAGNPALRNYRRSSMNK